MRRLQAVLQSNVFRDGRNCAVYFTTGGRLVPPGLTLSSSGQLSGTPTTPGMYDFYIRANDGNGCFGERTYTLIVNSPCPIITVSPNTLPVGQVGLAYSVAFSAIGGTGPYAYTIIGGPLPAGLSLSSNGSITGTPTMAGNYPFTVTATAANGCTGERSYILVINSPTCPAIGIDPPFLPAPRVGTAYNLHADRDWWHCSTFVQRIEWCIADGIVARYKRQSDGHASIDGHLRFYDTRD